MLQSLHISNVVLIQSLELDFNTGLCALTGETGAGKSILLDSLGLAMGARSEARLVRKGEDKASVTATFEIDKNSPIYTVLEENEIEPSSELILRRVVKSDGKSKAWINDQPISVSLLKQIGTCLVEYHGQFETHGLRDPERHGGMLDAYAGLTTETDELRTLWRDWRKAEKVLKDAIKKADAEREEEEYLRACLEDLDKLAPEQGEEDTLTELRQRIKNKEQIIDALSTAQKHLTSDKGAENSLIQATKTLDRGQEKIGQVVETMMEQLDIALDNLREVSTAIDNLMSDFSDEEISQEVLDDRLYALRSEARKHGCLVDDLSAKREEIAEAISNIERQDDILSELNRNVSVT
ncbi:MAG: AAA family ATPase, partial [Bdellovibrionales bacterium]